MRSNYIAASILALASYVAAQTSGFDPISSPTQDQEVAAGSTLDIVWDSTVSEKVTITLLQGATSATLQLGDVVASSIDSSLGTYSWTAPASAEYATYGFKLALDSNTTTFQYSYPFHVSSSGSSSSSSVASSAAAASSSSTAAGTSAAAAAGTTSLSQAEVDSSSASSSSAVSTTVAAVSGSASSAATTLSTATASAGFATSTSKSNSTKTNTTATSTATFATATGGAVSNSVGTLGLAAGLAVAFGMAI